MAAPPKRQTAMVASSEPSMTATEIEVPQPGPGQVLVRISHVAQNPTDVQCYDFAMFGNDTVLGCDFTGTVVELGKGVKRYTLGDKIAGLVWGGEVKRLGAYAEYTLASETISFKLPSGITSAAAATIPLAAATAWLALFSKSCLNMDRSRKQSLLVWGGSSSVGQYAIQLAAIHSFEIVTTCSPRNHDLVKSLGATHVFDYSSEDVAEQIRKAVPNLRYVFDTIGDNGSSALACKGAQDDCTMCTVRPGKANTEGVLSSVKITDVIVWTAFYKEIKYKEFVWPASQEDKDLSAELFEKLPEWIEDGRIKPNAVLPLKGLQSVPEGFQLYRDGKISGKKIVYDL